MPVGRCPFPAGGQPLPLSKVVGFASFRSRVMTSRFGFTAWSLVVAGCGAFCIWCGGADTPGQLDTATRLRYRRYDMFLATLHQVEMAHIPFPDEPLVVYPAPEVWKSLTERRQKWASVDLMKWNPT